MNRIRRVDIIIADSDTGEIKNSVSRFYIENNHEQFISIFRSFFKRVDSKPSGLRYTFQCTVSDYCKSTDVIQEPKLFDNIPSIF